MTMIVLQAIASGLVTGCVYALVALALVIVYKSTDLLNFGGGELVMIGAYFALLLSVYFGLGVPLAIPAVLAGGFLVGALFDRVVLGRIRSGGHPEQTLVIPMVLATLGLSFALKGAVRVVPYTEEPRRLAPLWAGEPVFLGPVVLQRQDLVIVGVTAAVMLGLWLFFRFSFMGRALRATSQNPRAASLVGMPVERFRMAVWGISSALAGIAGILLAPKLLMTPDMGAILMLALAAAIVGGITSLPGCVVGGVAIGILQNVVGVTISAQAIAVVPFFIIMVVLLVRPQGFFGDPIALKKV